MISLSMFWALLRKRPGSNLSPSPRPSGPNNGHAADCRAPGLPGAAPWRSAAGGRRGGRSESVCSRSAALQDWAFPELERSRTNGNSRAQSILSVGAWVQPHSSHPLL